MILCDNIDKHFNTIFILIRIQNITGPPNPSFRGANKFSFNSSNREKNPIGYKQLEGIAYKHGRDYEFGT